MIDKTAIIDVTALIRIGARIGRYVEIGAGSIIGRDAEIGAGARIGRDAKIGARARIERDAKIGAGSIIGRYTRIGREAIVNEGVEVGIGAWVGRYAEIRAGAKVVSVIFGYKYPANAYFDEATQKKMIRLGCFIRSVEDWEKDFNNNEAFPVNSKEWEYRKNVYEFLKKWLKIGEVNEI